MICVPPAVKYRPIEFDEIVGQEQTVLEILDAVRTGSLQSYILLSGPRGTGKTSIASVTARSLQCSSYCWDKRVCCKICDGCQKAGEYLSHFDCTIGGVSRNVLNALTLRRLLPPLFCRVHVVIFEEVHAWSPSEQRKLLVPLEKKSARHQLTIFTTTESNALIDPLRSRLVEYRLQRPAIKNIERVLVRVCKKMALSISADDLTAIAELSQNDCRLAVNRLPRFKSLRDRNPNTPARMLLFGL